ncbi:P-loop containing nucleoside triphosphate hydrolase protein [Trichophaea hybrida]|nr:P-loop containing nucleoside triphosphate hydrolase protein [Trichophaea hybrida]
MPKAKRPLEPEPALGQAIQTKRAKKSQSKLFLDELAWKEVAMPDRLDDVEGFFGLEEVDGVDVVGVEGGKIEFKLVDKVQKAKSKKAKAKSKPTVAVPEAKRESDGVTRGVEEEWGGISGTEAEPTKEKPALGKKTKKPKKDKKDKTVAQVKDKKVQQQTAISRAGNPFESLLEDRPGDDDDDDVDLPEWDELNLSTPTLQALAKLKFTSPTAIQSSAIPEILVGHDLIGKASTGSGKTLAFGIPILEAFLKSSAASAELANAGDSKNRAPKLPLALILSPTRELAHQLSEHLTALAAFVPDLRIVTLTGGLSLQKQQRQLEQGGGADLIIATPGRLWEVVSEGVGWIDKLKRGLKFLVVDEADRLLQEGHYKEVKELLNILQREEDESDVEDEVSSQEEDVDATEFKNKNKKKKLPTVKRQTLVFSATFHQGLQQKLASKGGKKSWGKFTAGGDLMDQKESLAYLLKKLNFREESPKFVDANPVGQLAERLREGIIECGAMEKDLYLYYLLLRYPCRTLVFTNSISSVKRLAPFLSELQLLANPLHSNMIQKARLRNLERFSSTSNPNSILIATDVAARGLDIKGVEMVIHYHLPRTADMYVHRSGRTARSDARGISILLCAPEEVMGVRRLVGKVHEGEIAKSTARYAMKSFGCDRKLVDRLKKRVDLAKKIADSSVEKMKKSKEDDWLKTAADELGVEYDSEDFNSLKVGKKGQRGKQKREKAANAPKADVSAWRAELRELLKQKINSGFSERYLTSGAVNIAKALLDGGLMHENILGMEKKSVMDEATW